MQEMWELAPSDRRYTMPDQSPGSTKNSHLRGGRRGSREELGMIGTNNPPCGMAATNDLHAWSIYRQNLNSDFTDSALGSDERSPLPFGNFQLGEQTVQSILRHPRLAPRSELGSNMYAYLKFGLPRVFPPTGNNGSTGQRVIGGGFKDASSGYDSTDERNHSPMNKIGGGHHHHHGGGGGKSRFLQQQQQRSSHIVSTNSQQYEGHHSSSRTLPDRVSRARSETDLRDGMIPNRFVNAKEKRLRSANSESNLLNEHRPMSKSGSQISLVSRNSRPGHVKGMNGHAFYSASQGDGMGPEDDSQNFEYPHLQVRGLSYEVKKGGKSRLLDGISFDLHGGELLAVMTTNVNEGTALLDILAGRGGSHGRVLGDFMLNGNPVTMSRLGSRTAYVRRDYRLHPEITVYQTMKFHSMLRKPIRSSSHEKVNKITMLLEELGLSAVQHSLVESLTSAEKQRLAVACQLLADTDIVLLDHPTKGMDIFDTFFLVDYLKQWGSRAKIIIMTIHPPTFEIFCMYTKVALVSTGRLMFYGHRREMLPYFAFIEYPCPGFKNPSDYYLDLVTLDDLSAEALLESSQRIEALADSFRRKQEPLSTPGPPQPLPSRVKPAGLWTQVWAIWMYTLVFSFPWNLVRWLVFMLVSTGLSVILGAIYWNVRLNTPQDQNSASDRLGLHWALMSLTSWPILLLLANRDVADVAYVTRDCEERLYNKGLYHIAKGIIELPFTISIFLGYVIPAYVMAGLNSDEDAMINFYIFIGYMVLFLFTMKSFLQATIHMFNNILAAVFLSGLAFFAFALSGFYTIHLEDLGEWCQWTRYISPVSWMYQAVVKDEMELVPSITCPRNPVTQDNNIVTQMDCRIHNGTELLSFWGVNDSWAIWIPILATFGFFFISVSFSFIGYILRRHGPAIPPPEKP